MSGPAAGLSSSNGRPALLASDLSLARGEIPIVHHVDLQVAAGTVHALIGPNGAGKSTVLAALAGDLSPAGGRVELLGHRPDRLHARELARLRAVVPQQFAVPFAFSCKEIIEMGRAPWKRHDGDESIVARAMSTTGTTGFADRPFSSLSGGERALVVLAKALTQTAPVLLLDEPTAALDLQHTEQVLGIVRERARSGDAVVIVVHDLSLAAAWADVVTVLDHGRVAVTGPPAQVLTAEVLTAVYRHPVEVVPHPRTGAPLLLPVRG